MSAASAPGALLAQGQAADWRSEWAMAEGFSLRRDATGFRFPTAIAFVPRPGRAPGDPLYFVTELQGTIRVVTNDRSVHLFATVPGGPPSRDTLPAQEAEVGLAGICLEPARGYVFATYTHRDSAGVLRNAVVRYETTPGRFGLAPRAEMVLRTPLIRDVSAASHQIGPCQASGNALFVSVGDGEQPAKTRELGSTLGKILRMGFDGRPLPDNPFAARGADGPAAYVWARGLRNPFGLRLLGGRLIVADNGVGIDRFLEVERGRDYLWDGSDRSIGAAAAQVISPSPGVVQLDYCTASGLPPSWRNRFYLALSGRPADTGPDLLRGGKAVMVLDYSLRERRMRSAPSYLARYRGQAHQSVVGLACGPDGVYFVPIFPDAGGESAVLVARYTPDAEHPYSLFTEMRPADFMHEKGCFGCHELGGKGGGIGPSLDHDSLVPRLRARLASPEYAARVRSLDSLDAEPFASYRGERERVLAATGDARLHEWIRYHIREPKFDNPNSQMPNLGVADGEAVALAEFLLTPPKQPAAEPRRMRAEKPAPRGFVGRVVERIPFPRWLQLVVAFAAGIIAGALLVRRRRSGGAAPG
ncbi:MAG TPA: PQQ-dependent sugar dehydrogenase [Gemmatimonadales bacterium]|nr:PQQ-dependent sugar dehydrogenase [Gemmatimonadales bacterium]